MELRAALGASHAERQKHAWQLRAHNPSFQLAQMQKQGQTAFRPPREVQWRGNALHGAGWEDTERGYSSLAADIPLPCGAISTSLQGSSLGTSSQPLGPDGTV